MRKKRKRDKSTIPFPAGVSNVLQEEKFQSKISKTLNSSCRTHFFKDTTTTTSEKKRGLNARFAAGRVISTHKKK